MNTTKYAVRNKDTDEVVATYWSIIEVSRHLDKFPNDYFAGTVEVA